MSLINSAARSRGGFAGENLLREGVVHAELGGEEGERIGEREDFQVRVNRLLGKQRELQRHLAGVGEFAKPFPVGFGPFGAGAEQRARKTETVAIESLATFQQSGARRLHGEDFRGGGDLFVGRERAGEFGFAREPGLELRLRLHFRGEQFRIEQAGEFALNRLPGILHAEEIVPGPPGVFFAALAPVAQQDFEPFEIPEAQRQGLVAQVFQFGNGAQPTRPPGVAGDESEFAGARARRGEAEKIRHLCRLAIFVGAKQADVQVMARELEVVRVAAVKSDLLLGRKDEPHIGVTLEAVKMIRPALPKRDDIGAQARAVLGLLLDSGDDLAARGKGVCWGGVIGHRGVDAGGDVLDGLQDVEFKIQAFDLLGRRGRVKAVAHIIFFLRADFLQRVRADVMVGNQEAVRAQETAGPAGVEAHGGFLQVVKPRLGSVELIPFAEQLARWLVVEPHAFVRPRGGDCGPKQEREQ